MRALLLLILTMTGCGADLPTYEAMAPETAWAIIAERAAAIEAVSVEADVTLMDASGDRMRVDAAIVMAAPNLVRLRAWKLGHAVFDVTVDSNDVWLDAPAPPDGEAGPLDVPPESLAQGLLMIPGWTSARPVEAELDEVGYRYRFVLPDGNLTCRASARTLVVTSWRLDARDATIELDDYRLVDGVVWPHRITLTLEGRGVEIRVRDVDFDDVDPRAFTPPRGARRVR